MQDAGRISEGQDARDEVEQLRRRTTPRRDLSRHERFDEVSPEIGVLDEAGFDRVLGEDADLALTMLADLTGATDRELARLARRLAGRLALDLTRAGRADGRGVRRLVAAPADRFDGDLDVDGGIEELVTARAVGRGPDPAALTVRRWARPELALCLLVDRSGSMGGERLAAAALAAAACAWRSGEDHSVMAFSDTVLVLKGQQERRPAAQVVDDLLSLRGFGPTDLSLGLRAARAQLAGARAERRLAVVLSDCRPTAGLDPAIAALGVEELVLIAPADDAEDARELARRVGARFVPLAGVADIPAAFTQAVDGR